MVPKDPGNIQCSMFNDQVALVSPWTLNIEHWILAIDPSCGRRPIRTSDELGRRMKKVIVTGGAGFIGSHTVVELAAAGYDPVIVDDLRNSQERALKGIEAIIGRAPTVYRIDCGDAVALRRVFAQGDVHGAIHFAADKSVHESPGLRAPP